MNIFDPWYRQNKIDKIYYHWNRNQPFIFHKIDVQTFENILNFHIISDTHIFHSVIQEYCNRPEGWQDLIIREWNKAIKEGDTVLHLGDFFLLKRVDLEKAAEFMSCPVDKKKIAKALVDGLNGIVYLIPGNHDRHGTEWYRNVGVYKQWKELSFQYENIRLIFSHRPVSMDRINNLEAFPTNFINIHGHLHHKGLGAGDEGWIHKVGPITFVNMSIECTNYRPVRLRKILQNVGVIS